MTPVSKIAVSEEDLIRRLRDQEESAMTILYDNYAAALYGVIFRIVKKEEIAEDVMQETFVKIWSSFSQYQEDKGRLFTWMINIARNSSIDKIRSREFRVSSRTNAIEESPVNNLHSTYNIVPEHVGLKEIVDKLNPEQKKIIDMMYFDGYSQSEISEELEIPLGTVKTRARAAMKILTKLLR